MGVPSNSDSTSQSKKIQDEQKRRIFHPEPFWFCVREAHDIWTRYISAKGQFKCGHLVNCWINHFLSKGQKIQESGNWSVDLAETRWESRKSIAKNMGIGQHTAEDCLNAEKFLKKHGLLKTSPITVNNEHVGRYVGLTKKTMDLFVEGRQLVSLVKSNTPPPPPQVNPTTPPGEIYQQSIRPNLVFNNFIPEPQKPTRINPKLGLMDW